MKDNLHHRHRHNRKILYLRPSLAVAVVVGASRQPVVVVFAVVLVALDLTSLLVLVVYRLKKARLLLKTARWCYSSQPPSLQHSFPI